MYAIHKYSLVNGLLITKTTNGRERERTKTVQSAEQNSKAKKIKEKRTNEIGGTIVPAKEMSRVR